jgi:hypothetical protein
MQEGRGLIEAAQAAGMSVSTLRFSFCTEKKNIRNISKAYIFCQDY